ncbi:MAG: DUF6732 family protein [Salaquimonas sp.]
MRVLLTSLPLQFAAFSADAHLGHLGELAGHGHWVALGAGLTAAAIAALVAKKKLDDQKNDQPCDGQEDDGECEPETAGA